MSSTTKAKRSRKSAPSVAAKTSGTPKAKRAQRASRPRRDPVIVLVGHESWGEQLGDKFSRFERDVPVTVPREVAERLAQVSVLDMKGHCFGQPYFRPSFAVFFGGIDEYQRAAAQAIDEAEGERRKKAREQAEAILREAMTPRRPAIAQPTMFYPMGGGS